MPNTNYEKKLLLPCLKCGREGVTFFEPGPDGKPVWINGCANPTCDDFANDKIFANEKEAVEDWNARNTKTCPFCGGPATFFNNALAKPGENQSPVYLMTLWGHSKECFFSVDNGNLVELTLAWNRRV